MTDTSNLKASKSVLFTRRRFLMGLGLGAVAVIVGGGLLLLPSTPTMAEDVVVYKDPSCECCGNWVQHMRQNGFSVTVHNVDDMDPIKLKAGVFEPLQSCHTASVGGYTVEGHVPADDIKRMLADGPQIKGLTVPGMPMSAPGMDSPGEPYNVLAFDDQGNISLYAAH